MLVTTGTRTGSGAVAAGADVLVAYKKAPSPAPAAARPKRETKINRLLMLCSISGLNSRMVTRWTPTRPSWSSRE
jgi:hypothetical protein